MNNDTREYILKTSLLLFLQKSYKAVTLKDIMDSAKLSKGAFYHYFKSKEEVFSRVIHEYLIPHFLVSRSNLSTASVKEFYTSYLKNYAKGMDAFNSIKSDLELSDNYQNANIYLLIMEALQILTDFKKYIIASLKEETASWEAILKKGIASGEIRKDIFIKQIAKLFSYTGDGVPINLIITGQSVAVYKELKETWDTLYQLIKK